MHLVLQLRKSTFHTVLIQHTEHNVFKCGYVVFVSVLLSVSVELGKGVVLPRMRNVQLVNTVLGVEEVSVSKGSLFSEVNVWHFESGAEIVVELTIVFISHRDL